MSQRLCDPARAKLSKYPVLLSAIEQHGNVIITNIPSRAGVLRTIKTFYNDFDNDDLRVPTNPAIRVRYSPSSPSFFDLSFSDSDASDLLIPYNILLFSKPIL